ncbi:MAG TPA: Spo0B C-terminal domain-containing protein [Bacillales bacterium]|nr:Spo0B C-terminal domain-containing protein [Bacillales bacterium]
MVKQWEPVELLRHTRHDWLNHIQLIKANLALNRIERANEIIEEITAQSHNESKLTNLHIPRVAEMLLTFNWHMHPYKLWVEVIGQERALSDFEGDLLSFFLELFDWLDQHADMSTETQALVIFELKDEGVALTVDFDGGLEHIEEWNKVTFLHKWFPVIEQYANEEEFLLTLKIM